jgi:hypothetical protein
MSRDLPKITKKNVEKLNSMDKKGNPLYFRCGCGSVLSINKYNNYKSHEKINKHLIYEIHLKEERQRLLKDYIKKNPNATEQELLDLIY